MAKWLAEHMSYKAVMSLNQVKQDKNTFECQSRKRYK